MNIGIDARPLIEKKSGIGYFLEYTLKNILELDQKNIYYLISDKEIYFDISTSQYDSRVARSGFL